MQNSEEKIRLILVDDHEIVRVGIKTLLKTIPGFDVIGEAGNENDLMALLKVELPDIILMDISLPGTSGIELTEQIVINYPEIKVIILSMYLEDEFVFKAIKAGAKGYLPKNTTKLELSAAISCIHHGQEYFSKEIQSRIIHEYVRNIQEKRDPGLEDLSCRELEILRLSVEGKSNQEVAELCHISVRTVESHKNHIMQKLNLKSSVEMVKFAIRNGLVNI